MIKAIETHWNNYHFRSRLEARWAVFFTYCNIRFQYEPEAFSFQKEAYLPDFYLPDQHAFVEVKPTNAEFEKQRRFAHSFVSAKLLSCKDLWHRNESKTLNGLRLPRFVELVGPPDLSTDYAVSSFGVETLNNEWFPRDLELCGKQTELPILGSATGQFRKDGTPYDDGELVCHLAADVALTTHNDCSKLNQSRLWYVEVDKLVRFTRTINSLALFGNSLNYHLLNSAVRQALSCRFEAQ